MRHDPFEGMKPVGQFQIAAGVDKVSVDKTRDVLVIHASGSRGSLIFETPLTRINPMTGETTQVPTDTLQQDIAWWLERGMRLRITLEAMTT